MCTTANLLVISYQNGGLVRHGLHGDREFLEHDGVVLVNTMPADFGAFTIGDDGVEKTLIEWGKKNLCDFFYKHDYVAKEVTVSFGDKHGNQFAGRFSTEVKFEGLLDFIAFGKRDDLRFASNKSEKDHAKLISEVQELRNFYKKAKAAEADNNN